MPKFKEIGRFMRTIAFVFLAFFTFASSSAKAATLQSLEWWLETLAKIQSLEEKIKTETDDATKKDLIKDADKLFVVGVEKGTVLLNEIKEGVTPSVDISRDIVSRDQYIREYHDTLRSAVFLKYLLGIKPSDTKTQGLQVGFPRTAGLASIGLSFTLYRQEAQRSGPQFANTLKEVQAELGSDSISPELLKSVKDLLSQAEQFYLKVAKEKVLPPYPSSRTFILTEQNRADLNSLPAAIKESILNADSEKYDKVLSSLAEAGSMEVFAALIKHFNDIESLDLATLTGEEKEKVKAYSDSLFYALTKLGRKRLTINPESKATFLQHSLARTQFRTQSLQPVAIKPASPRVAAAVLYGFSSSRIVQNPTATKDTFENERAEVLAFHDTLPLLVQQTEEMRTAYAHFLQNYNWADRGLVFPKGQIVAVDPDAKAIPVNASRIKIGVADEGTKKQFLPVDWTTSQFLENVSPSEKVVLENLIKLIPANQQGWNISFPIVQVLQTAKLTGPGILLAALDVLRMNRIDTFIKNGNSLPKHPNHVERSLGYIVTKWSVELRKLLKASGEDFEDFDLASKLLANPPKNKLREEFHEKLTRLVSETRDVELIAAGAKVSSVFGKKGISAADEQELLSKLRAFLNMPKATKRFGRRAISVFGGIIFAYTGKHFIPTSASVPQPVTPTAPTPIQPPTNAIPTQNIRSAISEQDLLMTLEQLSEPEKNKLPEYVRNLMWSTLLTEAIEKGIHSERGMEVLLGWAENTKNSFPERMRALQIILYSWDTIEKALATNEEWADRIDVIFSDLIRETKSATLSAEHHLMYKSLKDGFHQLRRVTNSDHGAVVAVFAQKVGCNVSMGLFGSGRYRVATPPTP